MTLSVLRMFLLKSSVKTKHSPYLSTTLAIVQYGYFWFLDFLDRFVYLDDFLIFSKNPTKHHAHVCAMLQRFLEKKLYIKAEKCEFHSNSVSFVGYV